MLEAPLPLLEAHPWAAQEKMPGAPFSLLQEAPLPLLEAPLPPLEAPLPLLDAPLPLQEQEEEEKLPGTPFSPLLEAPLPLLEEEARPCLLLGSPLLVQEAPLPLRF